MSLSKRVLKNNKSKASLAFGLTALVFFSTHAHEKHPEKIQSKEKIFEQEVVIERYDNNVKLDLEINGKQYNFSLPWMP